MKLSKVLYESVEEIWKSYLCHPFVKQLGEGTLSPDIFRYYMIQDYLYLLEYSKVFALGVVKSKQEKLMRKFASMVHNTLNGEMNIHKIYMERLGISEQEVSEAQQSILLYLFYILLKNTLLPIPHIKGVVMHLVYLHDVPLLLDNSMHKII